MKKVNIMRFTAGIMIAGILISSFTITKTRAAEAQKVISVAIDGRAVQFDQPPILENGRVLVPIRAIFEALGYSVDWEANEAIATGQLETENSVAMYAVRTKERFMWVNYCEYANAKDKGDKRASLETDFIIPLGADAPVKILNGRTLLPTRAISEALGCKVDWNGTTMTVLIDTSNAKIVLPPDGWIDKAEAHMKTYAPELVPTVQQYRKWTQNGVPKNQANENVPREDNKTTSSLSITQDTEQKGYSIYDSIWNREFKYNYRDPAKVSNPPVVGSVPAMIEKNPQVKNTASYSFKEYFSECYADAGFSTGGCNWYAEGRFWEVYGIPLPHFNKLQTVQVNHMEDYLNAADQYNELMTIRNMDDIRANSIVVYGNGKDGVGHVAFIEYVERDISGKATNIYITEANADNETGEYRHGIDGAVKKFSVLDFFNRSKPVIGYIVPNPDFFK